MKVTTWLMTPVLMICLYVFMSWQFNPDWMYRIQATPVNPLTAVILLANYIAFYQRGWISSLILSPAMILCFLVIADFFCKTNIDCDRLLWESKLGNNHMAPNTAVCLMLLSYNGSAFRKSYPIPVFIMILSGIAMFGHVFGNQPLYKIGYFTPMAVVTAVAIFFISISQIIKLYVMNRNLNVT